MKFKGNYHIYAFITVLFWSLAYVFTRSILNYLSVYSLGFLRYFIASITLIVVIYFWKIKLPNKKDLKIFILSGGVGFFLYMIFFNKGCQNVSAATSSIVIATVPIITALLANFIYKEKLTIFKWVAVAIEFIGILVLTLYNDIFNINISLIFLFLAAICLSLYNLIQKQLTKKYTPIQASSFSIFTGTIMLSIFIPITISEIFIVPPTQIIYIIILGVFSSAIAYISWSIALSKAKQTSSVSNYMFLTPFLTSVFGFLIINEIPDIGTIVGGSIILVGLFIFNFESKFIKK